MQKAKWIGIWIGISCCAQGIAQVVYEDDFLGTAGDARRGSVGLEQVSSQCELDGDGMLIAGNEAVANYRVQIAPMLKSIGDGLAAIRVTVVFRSPVNGWIGAAFTGERNALAPNKDLNGGPWIQYGPTVVFLRGGSGTTGSVYEFKKSYASGAIVTNEMTYYPDTQTADFRINGKELGKGLKMTHLFPGDKPSAPVLEWFQMIFFKQMKDGGRFESIKVEAIPYLTVG